MKFDEDHEARIRKELAAAGMSNYGLMKGETRHLSILIHPDEHIGGVIYGRYEGGGGMLVATNKRVLFLDHKLFFKKTDEISYDVVSGVSYNKQGDYAAVTLHTRLGDYTLRYVNSRIGNRFVHFIENVQIEQEREEQSETPAPPQKQNGKGDITLSQAAKLFLASHDLGVVSTIDQQGNVHGAAVYYAVGADDQIYFVTKNQTHKAQDILVYHQVALTIYDQAVMQTLQLSGTAQIERDDHIVNEVYDRVLHPRLAGKHAALPPILNISAGDYLVICIKPTQYQFHDYKNWS